MQLRIVQQGVHPFRPGQGVLNRHVGAVQALDRIVEHHERGHKGEKRAGRHAPVDDFRAAVPDHKADAEGTDKLHDGRGQFGNAGLAERDIDDAAVFHVKAGGLLFFRGKGLDHADAAEHLLQHAGNAGRDFGVAPAVAAQGAAEQHKGKARHRQNNQRPARQPEILVKNHPQQPGHGQHLAQNLHHGRQTLPDHADVVDDPRHEHPDLRALVKAQRQADDLAEQFLPHLFQHAERAVVGTPVLHVTADALDERQGNERQRHIEQGRRVLADENVVQRGLDEPGRARRGRGDQAGGEQGRQHHPLVRPEEPQHAQSEAALAAAFVRHVGHVGRNGRGFSRVVLFRHRS